MCGIAGVATADTNKNHDYAALVASMNLALAHRGPDGDGVYKSPSGTAILGNRRLSIIDLSEAGHQPMSNENKDIWVALNGEIYNYLGLKKELLNSGHVFSSNSDTEVLVHGYEEWGIERLLKNLRGMFSFVIWDERRRELLLARDRLGIKPLYYCRSGNTLAFASEVKALRQSGIIDPSLNKDTLYHFLKNGSVPSPMTPYQNIWSLQPGHFAVFRRGKLTTREYWGLVSFQEDPSDYGEAVERTRTILDEAIRIHLLSDVPVGAFLSGGIDSTSIVALASKFSDNPIRTVCVTFDEDEFNEASFAKVAANKFDTDHSEVRVTGQDFLDSMPQFFDSLDQPSVDGFNTYFVAKAAHMAGLKVVLSGLGGDEIFWGYKYIQYAERGKLLFNILGKQLNPLFHPGIDLASRFGRKAGYSKLAKLNYLKFGNPEGPYWFLRGIFSPQEIREFAGNNFFPAAFELATRPELDTNSGYSAEMFAYQDIHYYLQNQLLRDSDVMSMAHSIELRVPFLDHELVEFALGQQPSHKLDYDRPKKLLLDALGPNLPAEIVKRDKKGFTFPLGKWLKLYEHEIRDMTPNNFISKRNMDKVWREFNLGKAHWSRLWALIVWENWDENHN